MEASELRGGFGLDNLVLAERPDPRPGPGQLLLEMRAASVNYRDLLTVQGHYNPRQPLPLVPFSDGVGVVRELGEGVTRVAEGDRVCPIFAQSWLAGEMDREALASTLGGPLDGTLARRMVLDQEGVVKVPDHLDDEEAACLPCAALTAWTALVTKGRLKAGDTVLLLGTGGVSLFALQFARLLGAGVVITSSSDEKLARARELGADEVINYRKNPEWGKEAKALTGGRGMDQVVEVGGAETLTQSLAAMGPGGTVSVIGVLSGLDTRLNLIPVLMQNLRLQGIFVGSREGFEEMNRAIARHRLKPVVDRVFPFPEARAALEHLAEGKHFGKVCLRF